MMTSFLFFLKKCFIYYYRHVNQTSAVAQGLGWVQILASPLTLRNYLLSVFSLLFSSVIAHRDSSSFMGLLGGLYVLIYVSHSINVNNYYN